MNDAAMLLRMLRHGDSSFPAGGASFSWGLERLHQDGLVRSPEELGAVLEEQLRMRWVSSERAALAGAWHCGADLDGVQACDRLVHSQSLASGLRTGSTRSGRALLALHARLSTPGAQDYRRRVQDYHAPGHLPVMQGFLWRMSGVSLVAAEVMSAWCCCWAFTSAAVRLGLVTHLQAQHVLAQVEPVIAELMGQPAVPPDAMHAFTPETEIAAMRHERSDTRLFSN